MLYNKNQVRITNDKKKLVKKGKHWIVASAFVLALATGGYTVAGQVNADTATKPQAQAVTATPQKLSVSQNNDGSKPSTNNLQNQNRMTPSKDSQSTSVANIASQAHKMYSSVWNYSIKHQSQESSRQLGSSPATHTLSESMTRVQVPSSEYNILSRNSDNNIVVNVPNPGEFVKYISGQDGHLQNPESNQNGSIVDLTSDSSLKYLPLKLNLKLSNSYNYTNGVNLSTIPVSNTNTKVTNYVKDNDSGRALGYKMLNSDLNIIVDPKNDDVKKNVHDLNSADYDLYILLPKKLTIPTNQGPIIKNYPAIYFESSPAQPIQAQFMEDGNLVGNEQILAQGYLGDYADISKISSKIKLNIPNGTALNDGTGDPTDPNNHPLNHVPFSSHGSTIIYHVYSTGNYNYQPPFYAEEVNDQLSPIKGVPLKLEHFRGHISDVDTQNTFSDHVINLPLPSNSDNYLLPENENMNFYANFNSGANVQYNNWLRTRDNSSELDSDGVNRNGYWTTLDPNLQRYVWNYKGVPVIPYIKQDNNSENFDNLKANSIKFTIGIYAPKDIPFLRYSRDNNGHGLLTGSGGIPLTGTTNSDTYWYFPSWSNEYKDYPNGYKGALPKETFVPSGTYVKIPLTPGQAKPGYYGESTSNEFDNSPEWDTDGNNLYVTFHADKGLTYSLNGPSENTESNYNNISTLNNIFVHKTLPEHKYDIFFINPKNGSTQLQSDVISQNGSDLGPFNNNPKYNFSGDPEKYHISTVMAMHNYNLYDAFYDSGMGHFGNSDISKNRTDYMFYQLHDNYATPFATIPAGYIVDSHIGNQGLVISEGQHTSSNPAYRHNEIFIYVLPMPHQYTLGATSKVVGEDVSVPLWIQQLDSNGHPTSTTYTMESNPYYTNFNDPTTFTEPSNLSNYAKSNWQGYNLVSSNQQSEVIPQPNSDDSNIKPIIWYYAPSTPKVKYFTPEVQVVDYIKPSNATKESNISTWTKENSDTITLPTQALSDSKTFTFNPSTTSINGNNQSLNNVKSNEGYSSWSGNSSYTWTTKNMKSFPIEDYYTTDGQITIRYVDQSDNKQIGPSIDHLEGNSSQPTGFEVDNYTGDLLPKGYEYAGHYSYTGNNNPTNSTFVNGQQQFVDIYVNKKPDSDAYVTPSSKVTPGQPINSRDPNGPTWPIGTDPDSLEETYTRNIYYKDAQTGNLISSTKISNNPDTQLIIFTRTAVVDKDTGELLGYLDTSNNRLIPLDSVSNNDDKIWKGDNSLSKVLSPNLSSYGSPSISSVQSESIDPNSMTSNDMTDNIDVIYDESSSPSTQSDTYTRTIHYVYYDKNGNSHSIMPDTTQSVSYKRSLKTNEVTGDVTYDTWEPKDAKDSSWSDVKVPSKIGSSYDNPSERNIGEINDPSFNTSDTIIYKICSTIKVNYIDKVTGQVISSKSDTKDVSTPFDIDKYLSNLPSGYEYVGLRNDSSNDDSLDGKSNMTKNTDGKFDGTKFDYNDHIIDVLLTKEPKRKVIKSTITVDYINKADGRVIGKAGSDTEDVSTPFDIGNYLNNLPSGYEYAGVKNANSNDDNDDFNGTEFDYKNHTINVLLVKIPQGTINVNYVDKSNNRVLAQAEPVTNQVGHPFDISNYLKENDLPSGYEYAGMTGDTNYFESSNHTINILLIKVPTPNIAKSTITINYLDKETGKAVIPSKSDTENVSTDFDIDNYLSNLPSGYEYTGIKSANSNDDFNGTEFDYNNHTIDVLLTKAPVPKVAKSTITVDYVNKASGSVIGKAGSDTEDITTPFDIGQYLSNLPSGYEYAGIKGDVNSFDYDNHTVSILLIKAPKFTPASSSSKPITPKSAKSNGNSKASAKSKPTSKSSAKVVPNSASGAPDSSAIPANEPSSSASNNDSTNSSISSASMPSSASSVSASSATSSTNSSKASNTSSSTSNGKRSRNRAAMLKKRVNKRYSRHEQREQKVGRRVYLDNLMSTNRSFKFGDHRFMNLRHSKRLPQTGESMTHSSAWAAALMGLSAVMAGLGHAVGFKKRHE